MSRCVALRTLLAARGAGAAPALSRFASASPAEHRRWPLPEFPEPSGIAWHPVRGSLFLVGDEGDIGEVSLDGKLLRKSHLGGDLEAITVDPKSGLLYVVREGHEVIFEVRPDNFSCCGASRSTAAGRATRTILRRGGDGVEGLDVRSRRQRSRGRQASGP